MKPKRERLITIDRGHERPIYRPGDTDAQVARRLRDRLQQALRDVLGITPRRPR